MLFTMLIFNMISVMFWPIANKQYIRQFKYTNEMNKLINQKWFPHVVAIAIALATIFTYLSPMMSGKVLKQHDVKQWQATFNEIEKFEKESGERTFWTNSIFGGMPSYLIGPSYHNNFTNNISWYLSKLLPNPTDTLFLLFICSYIMLLVFNVPAWWAIAGALAFMFSTFNFINIDAGHVGKGNAIAYMPLVIAGIEMTLRKNKLLGAMLTGIAMSFQLTAGHLQITYYLMIMVLVWMAVELVLAIRERKLKDIFISGIFMLLTTVLGIGTNATNLMATEEYGKYSIRGVSELTKTAQGNDYAEVKSSGLDKDYALQWSNGTAEAFTLLIPNFYGGANSGDPHTQEILAKHFKSEGFPQAKELAQGMPAYFGEQPFTAGPIYYGAVICFLFILGLFIIRSPMKWWIFGVSALAIMLAMGKNFMGLTDLFFYYFPLYNKFRSVTFILAITQTTFPLLALLAIKELNETKMPLNELKKRVLYSLGVVGGLCLVFVLVPGIASVASEMDERMREGGYPMEMIYSGREKLRQYDAFRSLVFVLLSFSVVWLFMTKKIKPNMAIAAFIGLVLVDLWGVNKRFLNEKDFEKKRKQTELFPKTYADEVILQDKDLHYRVFNTTQRLDQDAITSYWHKSIGGYHGAKMRRYQEFIEFHLAKGNPESYNMLNVKYFIVSDSSRQNLFPQQNPDANGNAWFVQNLMMVPNADAEIDTLAKINTKTTAVVDERFADLLKDFQPQYDSTATIKLTSYAPNKLTYDFSSSSDQLTVFSEIFYDKGWNAYIDGQATPHFRCNYILRGMKIPAGSHKLEFVFEPEVISKGENISLIASLLLYGGVVIAGGITFAKRKKENA
jgi:hypothetical protein